jgi:hypothetical protein
MLNYNLKVYLFPLIDMYNQNNRSRLGVQQKLQREEDENNHDDGCIINNVG